MNYASIVRKPPDRDGNRFRKRQLAEANEPELILRTEKTDIPNDTLNDRIVKSKECARSFHRCLKLMLHDSKYLSITSVLQDFS